MDWAEVWILEFWSIPRTAKHSLDLIGEIAIPEVHHSGLDDFGKRLQRVLNADSTVLNVSDIL